MSLWLGDGEEAICLSLVLGGGISELAAFLMTWLAYAIERRNKARTLKVSDTPENLPDEHLRGLSHKLLSITVPVTLSACLRSGLLTLQHILIPKGLKASGADWSRALSSYGTLHSMVLPVVLFPSAFISSFSSLLVPEIAESHAAGDMERVARISRRIIQPALFFSFGVAGIMSCFSHELGMLLYNSAEAGSYIRQLAPLIPIMYVDSSVDAVLKGMGEQVYSMNVNIIDAGVSVLLVWLLLPRMGLAGYVVAIYVTETLNTTLSLCRMLRMSRMPVKLWKQVFGPLLCAVGAATVCRLVGAVFQVHGNGTARVILWVTVCAAVYLVLCLLTNVWSREQTEDLRKVFGHKQREA